MRQKSFLIIGLVGAFLGTSVAGVGLAAESAQLTDAERSKQQLFRSIQRELLGYPHYTVFDSVSVQIEDGAVRLLGRVTMPYKKDDLEKRVKKVKGVTEVDNQIGVLPASKSDDELRQRIANAIYSHPAFQPYAAQPNPPIHIIVERGRVRLEGVVQDEAERLLAMSLAGSRGALQVTNALQTTTEAAAQLGRL